MPNIKILKKVWDEFIYGGHSSSLEAPATLYIIAVLLNLKIDFALLFIGYLIAQIVYLFDYIFDYINEANGDITTNLVRNCYLKDNVKMRKILLLIYVLLLLIFLIFFTNFVILMITFLILMFGLLYGTLFKKYTRKIIAFKNLFVSFFWSFSPLILIFFNYQLEFTFLYPCLFIFWFIFLRLLLNTIYFDIKDIFSDSEQGLKTLPVVLGKEKTLFFLHILNVVSFLPLIFGVWINVLPLLCLWLVLFYFYSAFYLIKSNSTKANIHFLSYILADGEYILWSLVIFLAKLNP